MSQTNSGLTSDTSRQFPSDSSIERALSGLDSSKIDAATRKIRIEVLEQVICKFKEQRKTIKKLTAELTAANNTIAALNLDIARMSDLIPAHSIQDSSKDIQQVERHHSLASLVAKEFNIQQWMPKPVTMKPHFGRVENQIFSPQHYKTGFDSLGIAYDADGKLKLHPQITAIIHDVTTKYELSSDDVNLVYKMFSDKDGLYVGYNPKVLKVLQELQYNAYILAVSSFIDRIVWGAPRIETQVSNLTQILDNEDTNSVFHYISTHRRMTSAEIKILQKIQNRIVVLAVDDNVADGDLKLFKNLRYLDIGTNVETTNEVLRTVECLSVVGSEISIELQKTSKITNFFISSIRMIVDRPIIPAFSFGGGVTPSESAESRKDCELPPEKRVKIE